MVVGSGVFLFALLWVRSALPAEPTATLLDWMTYITSILLLEGGIARTTVDNRPVIVCYYCVLAWECWEIVLLGVYGLYVMSDCNLGRRENGCLLILRRTCSIIIVISEDRSMLQQKGMDFFTIQLAF